MGTTQRSSNSAGKRQRVVVMKKKVLFVMNTMGRAGAERCLLHLLNAWDEEEYEISLFAVLGRGELFAEVPGHVRILNASPETASVFDWKARKQFARQILRRCLKRGYLFRQFPSFVRLLLWQLRNQKIDIKKLCWKLMSDTAEELEEEFDLAVGYLQGAATYYTIDRVKAARKVVFLHNEYEASGYCPRQDSFYYGKADRIYCVSHYIAERLRKVFPACSEKIEVFYNFTDPEWIRRRAEEGRPDGMNPVDEGICLLTAARLEPVKAFDVAVQAMALLKQNGIKAVWYVLGDGSLKTYLEKEIKKRGLSDRFILLGLKENPYPYIRACDIYVQETRYEGFCTSITEAVVLGRRIVASDCGGNREQLRYYGTGVLTKLEPQAIVDGILKAAAMPSMQIDIIQKQKRELDRLKGEISGRIGG